MLITYTPSCTTHANKYEVLAAQSRTSCMQAFRTTLICGVGQNHIYTVYIRSFWQGNHQVYGHIRCIYTVLANPTYMQCSLPNHAPLACRPSALLLYAVTHISVTHISVTNISVTHYSYISHAHTSHSLPDQSLAQHGIASSHNETRRAGFVLGSEQSVSHKKNAGIYRTKNTHLS